MLYNDSFNPAREISTEPCMVFITEKSSDAKQFKKSAQSGEFYMILIVFYGGHAKSNEKTTQNDEKSRHRIVKFGVRLVPGFLCVLASGDPPGGSLKARKKRKKLKLLHGFERLLASGGRPENRAKVGLKMEQRSESMV